MQINPLESLNLFISLITEMFLIIMPNLDHLCSQEIRHKTLIKVIVI